MSKTTDITKQITDINTLLTSAVPTLGLVIGAVNLVREMFRRKSAGEAELSFDQSVQILHDSGVQMVANADAWFAANPGYDPKTGKPTA